MLMNVGTLFTKVARTFPERLAIAYGDYEFTYQEANERINKLANALEASVLTRTRMLPSSYITAQNSLKPFLPASRPG